MSSSELIIMLILLVAMIPCTGMLLAALPWLMKRRECFAVTVPESAQHDVRLRGYKVRYSVIMAVSTVVVTAIGTALIASHALGALIALLVAGLIGITVLSFGLMLWYRAKVMQVKRDEGWAADSQQSVSVSNEDAMPKPISLRWNLLYVPIIVVTAIIGIIGYPLMPDMIPMKVGFSGEVTQWIEKGPAALAFPLLVQGFMAVVLAFSHWSILRSKKGANPEMPVATTWAYGMFARAQSILLLVSGCLIIAAMALFPLSNMGLISIGQSVVIIMLCAFVIVIGSLVLSAVYGQSGSRAIRRMAEAKDLSFDDDAYWKLGVFYWNPQDASLFVPARFGIGWTMNFGSRACWGIIAGGTLFIIAFLVLMFVLV